MYLVKISVFFFYIFHFVSHWKAHNISTLCCTEVRFQHSFLFETCLLPAAMKFHCLHSVTDGNIGGFFKDYPPGRYL